MNNDRVFHQRSQRSTRRHDRTTHIGDSLSNHSVRRQPIADSPDILLFRRATCGEETVARETKLQSRCCTRGVTGRDTLQRRLFAILGRGINSREASRNNKRGPRSISIPLSILPPPQSYRRPRRVGSMRFSKSSAIRCKTGLLRFVWRVYLFVRCHMPAMRPPLCACTVHEEPMDPLFFLRFNTPITHRLSRDLSSQPHLFASPSLSLSLSLATRSRVFMHAYSCRSASIYIHT